MGDELLWGWEKRLTRWDSEKGWEGEKVIRESRGCVRVTTTEKVERVRLKIKRIGFRV